MAADDQEGAFDAAAFREELDANLAAGRVRLVFVLDEAPPELVRLVGYLEAMAEGLTIDLVTVVQYETGGASVLVPQRVDPERVRLEPAPVRGGGPKGTLTEGADAFIAAIDDAEPTDKAALRTLAAWAVELEREGLARLSTYRGVTGRHTLLPRLVGEDAGMVTLWNDRGAHISLWEGVIARVAPDSLDAVAEASGLRPIGRGRSVRDPSPELMRVLTDAYREAAERRSQQRG